MSRLAQQQQALLARLFDWPPENAINNIAAYADSAWARGQKVYQSNGHALARCALRAAYPVLVQLLGDESFDALARALWHAQPPLRGDVAQWGGTLAGFVRDSRQLADTPYLADVAALEWALHRAASAADGLADPASFALLTTHDPADVQLVLSPGSTCLNSRWPVVSIINAHLRQPADLRQVGQLLRDGIGQHALVWRSGWQALVREAVSGEAAFMTALLAGQTLAGALDQAQDLDIGAWLPMAVQSGLLLGVRLAEQAIQKTGVG
jgi:hypothetical protein